MLSLLVQDTVISQVLLSIEVDLVQLHVQYEAMEEIRHYVADGSTAAAFG